MPDADFFSGNGPTILFHVLSLNFQNMLLCKEFLRMSDIFEVKTLSMTKSAVIFQDKPKQKKNFAVQNNEEQITLSRDAYKERLQDAYQERKKEAFKDKKQVLQSNNNDKIEQEGKEEAIKKHAKEKEENR